MATTTYKNGLQCNAQRLGFLFDFLLLFIYKHIYFLLVQNMRFEAVKGRSDFAQPWDVKKLWR